MTKRKHTKKKNSKRKHSKQQTTNFKLINTILAIIIALILVLAYIVYTTDTKELTKSKHETTNIIQNTQNKVKNELSEVEKKAEQELNKYINDIEIKKDKFEEYTKDLYEEYIDKETIEKTKLKDTKTNNIDKKIDKQDDNTIIKKVVKVKDRPIPTLSNRPKLAIIFDDITTQYQVNKIKDIGYTTTISAMPPTKSHPNSANITKDLPFYMIHFPLEATSFRGEETDTLHIGDSYEKIEKRVAKIREWYPNAKYTNNHTGSKFTADEESMDKLFRALVKYDFIFMDSRTTGKTVAKKMAEKYNMPYIVRNVFLDNEQKFDYIQNQLKKAIRIAKKNGFAIAICHPHSMTIKTLKKSKHLLNGLEMVYLNQLPYLNK